MAAPSSTVWGSVAYGNGETGRSGRIGIYVSLSSTATETTATVQVWFWSKYGVSDENNVLYFDNLSASGSATTSKGSVDISTTVSSGDGWSTSNQKLIATYTYSYTRSTSASTRYLYAKLTHVERVAATMYASTTFTVPALASYTVSYNANGGSGAPSNQTKWYGKNLTLSSTKPIRTGYSFQGWATSASGSVAYAAGASYTANAAVTLYAVWKANTYTVSYNANGGSGAPSSQTKTYGVTLKLSTTKPTRENYNFLGWATSASATTATYASGANYTANAKITLYAVWELAYVKPRITNLSVSRYDTATSSVSDSGTSVLVKFDYECDLEIDGNEIEWESEIESGSVYDFGSFSGTSGTVEGVIDGTTFTTESTYTFKITVTDANDYSTEIVTLPGMKFAIDFKAGGNGAAFGKPAELEGVLDVAFQTRALGGYLYPVLEPETDLNDILTPNSYVGANVSNYNYINCPLTSGTFTLEVTSMGEDGQVKQRLTYCHKTASRVWERIYYTSSWGEWICVSDFDGQLLWEGGFFMHDTQEIPLAEPVSKQRTGIVLVFCRYSGGEVQNYHFTYHFVPKMMVAMHGGCGSIFQMGAVEGDYFAAKYLYISDQTIKGNSYNDDVITDANSGITYTNNATVLRYVIGV